jgi:hypothetical protein
VLPLRKNRKSCILIKSANFLICDWRNLFADRPFDSSGTFSRDPDAYRSKAPRVQNTEIFMFLRAILCTFQISVDFYFVPVCGRGGGRGGAGRGGGGG